MAPGMTVLLCEGGDERAITLTTAEATVADVLKKAGVQANGGTLMLDGRVVTEDDPVTDRSRVTILPKSSKLG